MTNKPERITRQRTKQLFLMAQRHGCHVCNGTKWLWTRPGQERDKR